jgi:hypothetical protein
MVNTNDAMTRTLFGDKVSLADYDKMHTVNAHDMQMNAKFIKFCWMDLSGKKHTDPDLANEDIRDEQNDRFEELQNLATSLSHGWDTSFFPPCLGTDGLLRDGRSRVLKAIENGEKWIVVALYSYEVSDRPAMNYLVNGLWANDRHRPAQLTKTADYEGVAVRLIIKGELKNDAREIDDFLYRICRIERRFSNVNGTITKIRNNIMKRAAEGVNGTTVRRKDEKEWQEWIQNSILKNPVLWQQNYNISDISDIAFHKTGRMAAERILTRHILSDDGAAKGKVTNIILYGDGTRENLINDHVTFEETLQGFYHNIYKWVNNEINGIELKHDTNSPMWRIVGVIPQFIDDEKHDAAFNKGQIISMNDIRKLHPMNNILPFAA